MRKIVVASHSLLAQGFKDTLEFLTGKGDAVNAVCAYVNGASSAECVDDE